jgi:oligopeptide/dipeptide ABC transporter ATP-binding protein
MNERAQYQVPLCSTPPMKELLRVKRLTVGVKRVQNVLSMVDDISFDVNIRETLGIVGESGSGKSTTGLAILRLTPRSTWAHTRGQILFDGRDVLAMNESELRAFRGRDISMILQDPMASLNPAFTIGNQIEEAFAVHGDFSKAERRARAVEMLRRVRIPDPERRVREYPHQLSGGMKQRVVGAIALAGRPKLLIADEPTTSLDVTIQAQYLNLLKELQSELGMAMVFITHDFGVVAAMCDRVCVMYAGQIVETVSVRDLFARAAHWYTVALIDSVPKLNAKAERLVSISGSPPRLAERAAGCRFAPRCPHAQAKCTAETPMPRALSEGHTVVCWYPRI